MCNFNIDKAREKQITTNAEAAYVAAQALATEAYGKGVKSDGVYKYVLGVESGDSANPTKIVTLTDIQASFTASMTMKSGSDAHDPYIINTFDYTQDNKTARWYRSGTDGNEKYGAVGAGGWIVSEDNDAKGLPASKS